MRIRSMMLSAKTCGQHNKVIDSVSTIRLIVLISVVLSFLVGRGSLLIQCQEFEILFIPFISASILIICCAYINNVQSYAIICKIYPFCPFFFIFAAFLGKNRGRRRVFCHSKQLVLRPFAHRPLAQKVAQPLSRRPAKMAQICRRLPPSSPPYPPSSPPHPPSSLPIVFHFSATFSVFFADSLPLLRRFIRLDRHILHLAAAPIHLLRRSGCLARHSDPPVRHRANLARYQLYVGFRA